VVPFLRRDVIDRDPVGVFLYSFDGGPACAFQAFEPSFHCLHRSSGLNDQALPLFRPDDEDRQAVAFDIVMLVEELEVAE
jgi:hypothetical protein